MFQKKKGKAKNSAFGGGGSTTEEVENIDVTDTMSEIDAALAAGNDVLNEQKAKQRKAEAEIEREQERTFRTGCCGCC